MNLVIRPMLPEDVAAKGYVHWKSWQETYPGMVDADYLSRLTLEKCVDMAKQWPDNILVALLDGEVVGFSAYGTCRSEDLPDSGEVFAVYVLKKAQKMGIGRKLMDAAFEKLKSFDTIAIWALDQNRNAIAFYEHYGFRLDGASQQLKMGTYRTEVRLVCRRANTL